MKVLVSGASGLIGQEVEKSISKQGHQVVPLKRGVKPGKTACWDIENGIIDLGEYQEIDVVIHFAGESIAEGRWSQQKKERIKNSRVNGTKLLSEHFSNTSYKPKLFLSSSAIGFYGNRGNEELSENSNKGTGFLSDVCAQWENATSKLPQAGIRVANIRLGMVLSSKGGALQKMLFPFKIGFGGIIGDGKQYISWVTIDDVVGAVNHIIKTDTLSGAINVVAPTPVTNYVFTKTLGKALNRPTIFPLPAFVANIIFGEMAKELLLTSIRAFPKKLQKHGYDFKYTSLENALTDIIAR